MIFTGPARIGVLRPRGRVREAQQRQQQRTQPANFFMTFVSPARILRSEMISWSARRGKRRDEPAQRERHACPHRGGPARHRRPRAAHADAAGAEAVRAHRRRGLRQIREPAGHQLVQGARRAQQARFADRRRARARRDRHVGRQSRPGGRLSRREPRHSGDRGDAGDDAVREGGGDQGAWRRRSCCEGETISEAQARAEADGARARADLGASLRRRQCDRRPGHHRARNAGGGAPTSTCW